MNLEDFFSTCIAIATSQQSSGSSIAPPTYATLSTSTPGGGGLDTLDHSRPYPGASTDFYGLPSNPRCIFKTGSAWPVRKGPEAQRVLREARPICNHPIQEIWTTLGVAVYQYLDSVGVAWTTIDPVRFAESGGEPGPLLLWVGVNPNSLSLEDAKAAAEGCKGILNEANFPEVEIAFRESVYSQSTGPRLLKHGSILDPTIDIRAPFTPALSLHIAPRDTPHYEGSGALYLCESSNSNRVFLLTSRHVVLPPPLHENKLHERKSTNRDHEVLILGSKAYPDALDAMMSNIRHELSFTDIYLRAQERLGEAVEGEDAKTTSSREELQARLDKIQKDTTEIATFHSEITRNWSTPSQRVLGHVIYSPPISVGSSPTQYTEDWALIEVYRDKIDWKVFKGNVFHLGNKISTPNFLLDMYPHPDDRCSFEYPDDGLLQIKGIAREEEIRQPKQLDAKGEECLLVTKNGRTTGVTIGRGTGIESFVRVYNEYGIESTSKGIAIYSYSYKHGPFSAVGDSGSIVIDREGRIIGLLTGGAGVTDSTDVTYLTPYYWLDERIKAAFPNSFLYPIQ